MDVHASELIRRLKGRRQCSRCGRIYGVHEKPKKKGHCDMDNGKLISRNDDKPSVIHHRFSVYEKETLPVLEWASKQYPVFRIQGNDSPAMVFKRVSKIISLMQQEE